MNSIKKASSSSSKGGGKNKVYGYMTANSNIYFGIKKLKNKLKEHPTHAEELLWQELRKKSTGYRIRRQHIIGNFIVDFVCLKSKLVIEVDGEIHDLQKEYDTMRTEHLNLMGYRVIRFKNKEVIADPKSVKIKIEAALNTQSLSPPLEG